MASSPRQSSGPVKVVAVFREVDRQGVKGFVFDFSPQRDKCRIFPSEAARADEAQEIDIRKLKAIFFVKEFADLEHHTQTHSEEFVGVSHGRKMEVTLADGERLVGTTEGYNPKRLGFFLIPPHPQGNNLRVFVVNASVREVKWLRA